MNSVLIVSRTKMKPGNVCVGGFDIDSKQSVRLLTSTGSNQPDTCSYQVGQIWDVEYLPKNTVIPPHVEDVMVQNSMVRSNLTGTNLQNFILQNCNVHDGSIGDLFGGALHTPTGHAAYIDSQNVPNHSVCFWRTDSDLHHFRSFDKDKYNYIRFPLDASFSYAGTVPVINVVPAGTIVRMSLARWWMPPEAVSQACYLQLSGWY
ncbi:MAG: dual OB domain-containing protein [Methylobacter sp.]